MTKIILASQSPRRKEILEDAGYQITVDAADIDESPPPEISLHLLPEYLAEKKADAVSVRYPTGHIIIGADTIVIKNQQLLGKPKDASEAQSMLAMLSGDRHKVITGVCIIQGKKRSVFSEEAIVHLSELSPKEINYYIDKFEPYDKAGAYGIQEWIGQCKITKIEGTYSNIKGLPMAMVYKHLSNFLA